MIDQHIVQSYNEELNDLKDLVNKMMQASIKQLDDVYSSFASHNKELANDIIKNDKVINELDKKIIKSCINILSLRNPLAYDLRFVFSCSHISRNLERIGDNSRNVARHVITLEHSNEKLESQILQMIHSLLEMLHGMQNAFIEKDADLSQEVILKDLAIDTMYTAVADLAIAKIKDVKGQINTLQSFILMSRYLERIGDHIINICKHISFIERGEL